MTRFVSIAALIIAIAVNESCVTVSATSRTSSDGDGSDASGFTAVVKMLRDSTLSIVAAVADTVDASMKSLRLAVDARPLAEPVNAELPVIAIATTAPVSAYAPTDRVRALAELRIPTADIQLYLDCPATGAINADRRACPRQPVLYAAIGAIREGATCDSIPVLAYVASRAGRNALVTSFIVRREGQTWKVVKKTPSVIIE